jgi:hypothetical protein
VGKLSEAQKDAMEYLYEVGKRRRTDFPEPNTRTLGTLVRKGFVKTDEEGFAALTVFGENVVKMMRGELRKPRSRR